MTPVRELVAEARQFVEVPTTITQHVYAADLIRRLADALERRDQDGATALKKVLSTPVPAQAEPTAPSVDAVLREVEERLKATAEAWTDDRGTTWLDSYEVARRLVAATTCPHECSCEYGSIDHRGCARHGSYKCRICNGTGIDPVRLEAALKAGEAK